MTLEVALTARASADVQLTDAIGAAGGWTRRLTGLPEITFQTVADPRPEHFKGFQPRQTTVQVDVWAATAGEAAALRERCIATFIKADVVEGVRFQRAVIANVRAGAEPEQSGEPQRFREEIARESIDIIFTHTPA
ncbi:hypothetical protein ASE95_02810 [Sphingomonas sp. Leaf231]|uniref:tail completion protein gp17 n=1 Tax=Sphingomonas sp. Leaf231 TaxID=1736301 RepID=UPI0006F60520|nr:DUF3168 domain-containing protein [Sphingomonas sp. Leaf231]KQN93854.1 hypothetical protein ASE95_02810 [Sphingomonas sp. Leaf231]